MQNVRANVKVMEFQSLCIFSCILTLLIILIKSLTTKAHDRRTSGDCGTSGNPWSIRFATRTYQVFNVSNLGDNDGISQVLPTIWWLIVFPSCKNMSVQYNIYSFMPSMSHIWLKYRCLWHRQTNMKSAINSIDFYLLSKLAFCVCDILGDDPCKYGYI